MAFLPRICNDLTELTGVPVVNPVVAALKTAEMLAGMRLAHSKVAYAIPKQQFVVER
jgi:Asp/Glu/hydantoin racemase